MRSSAIAALESLRAGLGSRQHSALQQTDTEERKHSTNHVSVCLPWAEPVKSENTESLSEMWIALMVLSNGADSARLLQVYHVGQQLQQVNCVSSDLTSLNQNQCNYLQFTTESSHWGFIAQFFLGSDSFIYNSKCNGSFTSRQVCVISKKIPGNTSQPESHESRILCPDIN